MISLKKRIHQSPWTKNTDVNLNKIISEIFNKMARKNSKKFFKILFLYSLENLE